MHVSAITPQVPPTDVITQQPQITFENRRRGITGTVTRKDENRFTMPAGLPGKFDGTKQEPWKL